MTDDDYAGEQWDLHMVYGNVLKIRRVSGATQDLTEALASAEYLKAIDRITKQIILVKCSGVKWARQVTPQDRSHAVNGTYTGFECDAPS